MYYVIKHIFVLKVTKELNYIKCFLCPLCFQCSKDYPLSNPTQPLNYKSLSSGQPHAISELQIMPNPVLLLLMICGLKSYIIHATDRISVPQLKMKLTCTFSLQQHQQLAAAFKENMSF
jgi:hypothetical protein